jgi:alkylation response protein AidB-like acyl-CoA dehydrogenase
VTPEDYAAAVADLDHLANPMGIGWAGPTIVAGGSPDQQDRWLPGILDGSEFWCQLFSEPDAGSDLASLQTRAVRDGDAYVITGQKIWSTWADRARWGILLARTDPRAATHKGISYFVLDMTSPGIEVRPIIEMTGGNHFNEVFLDAVVVPADHRIGAEGDGWRLARVTLANERDSLSKGGVLWGMGPTTDDLFALDAFGAGPGGPFAEPTHGAVRRQRAAAIRTEQHVLEQLDDPSVRKTLADAHGQHVMALAKDLRGAAGMLGEQSPQAEEHDVWHWGYLFSRALTIGGGTSEVQRSIIGEHLLGLPKEPKPAPGAGGPSTDPQERP